MLFIDSFIFSLRHNNFVFPTHLLYKLAGCLHDILQASVVGYMGYNLSY